MCYFDFMEEPVFSHTDYLAPGECFHFARTILPTTRPRHLHGQDFHEVFWIQNGTARHYVNDTIQVLSEGDLIFVGPEDRHGLQGLGEETWLVNILFHPDVIAAFADRHPVLAARFLTHGAPAPQILSRDMRQLAELSRAALRLETGPRTALRIDAFLLGLMAELDDATADVPRAAPDWLARACTAAQTRAVFQRGASGFVEMAGRQHAHVARVCRDHLGVTPTAYVNAIRMDYAARQLTGSSDSLTEIALDCGIENLSHFHRLFKARHGMTPKAWRRRYQHSVIQPI